MECFYINLDSAAARRECFENNFLKNKSDGWTLSRFRAVDANYIDSHGIAGALRPSAKACFISHKNLIKANLDSKGHIFLLEDDAEFGKNTCKIIDKFLSNNKNFEWDILFTDVCVPHLATMADLISLRHQLFKKNEITVLNLHGMPFAGSTAYILNNESKRKFFDFIESENILNLEYDLYIRKLIYEKKIVGYCFFPFLTTLSDESESSQIQKVDSSTTDWIWNMFRKMVWMDRDLNKQKPMLGEIRTKLCDEESNSFGILFSAMISEKFLPK